jgi:hypothetical protein
MAGSVSIQNKLDMIWGCQKDKNFAKPLTVMSFKIICALCPTAHQTYYFS